MLPITCADSVPFHLVTLYTTQPLCARRLRRSDASTNLLQRLQAIPPYRNRHRPLPPPKFPRRAPPNIVMFLGSERHRSVFRARPINHPDVLVCFSDTMNVQKAWRDQRASALSRGWGPFPEQLDLQPAFFFGFAQRSHLSSFR